MNRIFLASCAIFLAGTLSCGAVVFAIDLSPSGGTALNLGVPTTHYFGDHAVGAAAANETSPSMSLAIGNEIGMGITFDSVSKVLSFSIGFGSGFGFVDLAGAFTDAHFHAPGPVMFPAANVSGPVIKPIGGTFMPAGSPMTGSLIGSVVLSGTEEMALFDHRIYLNIHSMASPGGEIRAQLVPVMIPEPSGLVLLGVGAFGWVLRRRR